jgi:integrase
MLTAHRQALGVPEDETKLRKLLGLHDGDAIPREYGVEPWSFHDLRRTMLTRLSALPIPDEVRELMIAHRKPDLHQVYDQHTFREEKLRGFELWADRLLTIVEPPRPGKSVAA